MTAPKRGICFGYEPMSDLAFQFLREGSGVPLSIRIAGHPPEAPDREPLVEWLPPKMPTRTRLFDVDGGRFLYALDEIGAYSIDPVAPAIEVPGEAEPIRREERMWSLPTVLCFIARGDLPLHAAAVEVDGRALVIGGPTRAGKTTLAGAFLRAGCRVLAEDVVACRLSSHPAIWPGPAVLRLRPDAHKALGLRDIEVVARDTDRVHLALEGPNRGSGAPVPLSGVVLLEPGPVLAIRDVDAASSMPALWALSSKLPTDDDRARCFAALADLAGRVPLWQLERPFEWSALDAVVDEIVRATQ